MLNYIGFSTGYFDFIEFRLKITIDSIKNRRYIIRQIYLRFFETDFNDMAYNDG